MTEMTEIQTLVQNFEESLHDFYMDECKHQGYAVNPDDLDLPDWAVDLMGESFEIAMKIEGVMCARKLGWDDASDFV